MAEREQRDNSGILFKNNRKESDKHPDYNGSAMIDGVEFWMNAWLKKGNKGTFMTFSFSPKNASGNKKSKTTTSRSSNNDIDDDAPF